MARKNNVKEINLQIDSIEPFVNTRHSGFVICWSSAIGFGEYTVYTETNSEDGKWYGDSEYMDSNEDKEFITELMRLFVEQLIIS